MNGAQYPDAIAGLSRGMGQGIQQGLAMANTYLRFREQRIRQERQQAQDQAAAEQAAGQRDMNRISIGFKIIDSLPEGEQRAMRKKIFNPEYFETDEIREQIELMTGASKEDFDEAKKWFNQVQSELGKPPQDRDMAIIRMSLDRLSTLSEPYKKEKYADFVKATRGLMQEQRGQAADIQADIRKGLVGGLSGAGIPTGEALETFRGPYGKEFYVKEEKPTAEKGFTLGPGQVRFGPKGKEIARVRPKATEGTPIQQQNLVIKKMNQISKRFGGEIDIIAMTAMTPEARNEYLRNQAQDILKRIPEPYKARYRKYEKELYGITEKELTREKAIEYLRKAGGNKTKAGQMAKRDGYTF